MRVRVPAGILTSAAALAIACFSSGYVYAAGAQPGYRVGLVGRVASYLGVYEADAPRSYAAISEFARVAERPPKLVLYYSGWGKPFQVSFARKAQAHGATVVVDLDPTTVTVLSIANRRHDAFLRSFARQVRSFGHPVVISFGHEMNGDWYSWGWRHASPRVWVRAWRHVVSVFRQARADNVTWLWTVNRMTTNEGPIRDWWPGAAYVNWTGIDGYFYQRSDTFASLFGPTIKAIRSLTGRPILLTETAVGQRAGQAAKIPGLLAGVRENHLLGLIWFDVAQHGSIYKQDWRLEGHPAAIRAFRQAVRRYIS